MAANEKEPGSKISLSFSKIFKYCPWYLPYHYKPTWAAPVIFPLIIDISMVPAGHFFAVPMTANTPRGMSTITMSMKHT